MGERDWFQNVGNYVMKWARDETLDGSYNLNRVRGYLQWALTEIGKTEEEAADMAYDWLNAEQQKQAETDERESRDAAYERLRAEGW